MSTGECRESGISSVLYCFIVEVTPHDFQGQVTKDHAVSALRATHSWRTEPPGS